MLGRVIEGLERSHWKRETRRRVGVFNWGIEHLGGDPHGGDPRAFLERYARESLEASDKFFATEPADWYRLENNVLTFPSAIESAFPENNLVWARWFPSAADSANGRGPQRRRAVVVLPHWNAQPHAHMSSCRVLSRFGISALRLSLPYHDERKPLELERADHMVSANIGLTLQASRQAVLDVRRALRWLEQQGYGSLGLLGTSIGSAIGFITLAHEPALSAGAFLHVSTYFADVVRTGLTTTHVWAGMEKQVSPEELRHFWSPISPFPYVSRLKEAGKRILLVSGRYDLSFRPELSRQLWEALERQGIPHERLLLPCGHYTLAKPPFSWWAGLRFVPFLLRALA